MIECSHHESIQWDMNIQRQNAIEWQPPPANILKLNTDASYENNTQVTGFGVVTKDEYGEVILSASAKMSNISNSLHEEVLAILFGVKLMVEQGCLNVLNQIQKLL